MEEIIKEDLKKIQEIEEFFTIREESHRNNFDFPAVYTKQYKRSRINPASLGVPLEKLEEVLEVKRYGELILDYIWLVERGFYVIKTNTTYYGVINAGIIKELYVYRYKGN